MSSPASLNSFVSNWAILTGSEFFSSMIRGFTWLMSSSTSHSLICLRIFSMFSGEAMTVTCFIEG